MHRTRSSLFLRSLRPLLATLLILLSLPGLAAAQDGAEMPDPEAEGLSASERLEALIERIKAEQAALDTMEADFVQRKESELLLEPETSEGHFWFRAPDSVRWDFTSPADTVVVIDAGEMTTWYRDLGRAERVDIGQQADRVMEYLSASNSLETLQRYFTVRVRFPQNDGDPYALRLDPRFDRVAKRIEEMAIRLHPTEYYPLYLKYVEPDGDVTELEFDAIEVNDGVDETVFHLELPDDVEVREVELGARGETKGEPGESGAP